MTELVQAVSITIEVGGLQVVSEVSFTIGRGEIVALVGESGAGKSMCARAVTGTLGRIGAAVTGGELEVLGEDATAASRGWWRRVWGHRIGLIPQASMMGLDPLWTIRRQLNETSRHLFGRRLPDEDLIALLDRVGIRAPARVLSQYPHELSGGMRQRVMIALALLGTPELLVADEATTALDVTIQRSILLLIRALADDGVGVLLVTHDLGIVEEFADKVVIMRDGEVVEANGVAEIFTHPEHEYSRSLLAARYQLGRSTGDA